MADFTYLHVLKALSWTSCQKSALLFSKSSVLWKFGCDCDVDVSHTHSRVMCHAWDNGTWDNGWRSFWSSFSLSVLSGGYIVPNEAHWLLGDGWKKFCGSDSKESPCNAGNPSLTPGSGRFSREENDYPLQYSCLENSMDRRAWWVTVMESQRVGHDWATNTQKAETFSVYT